MSEHDEDYAGGADLGFDVVELVACPGHASDFVPGRPLREVAYRADAWSPGDISSLTERFRADEGLDDIAAAIGRTLDAVRTKIHDLGLRRNSSRPWAEMEDQLLIADYGTYATAVIAGQLGRTVAAVYARASVLGLTEGAAPPWTPWEDAQLVAGYREGIVVLQLAALIGRPLSGAVSRATVLGLKHKNWNPDWTDEEKALAIELVEQGRTAREIGFAFEQHGFRGRSKNAVGPMLRALGYERSWGRPWLPEEVDALRTVYATGGSVAKLAARMGRSRTSVRWKVEDLGLNGTHVNAGRGFLQGDDWPEEDKATLRRLYGTMPVKEIAALLKRPLRGVYTKAHVFGLSANYHRDWPRDEDVAIAIAYAAGISMTDLALALDRAVAVVSKRAIALGLAFQGRPTAASRARRNTREPITLKDILALGDRAEYQWAREIESPVPKKRGKRAAAPAASAHAVASEPLQFVHRPQLGSVVGEPMPAGTALALHSRI